MNNNNHLSFEDTQNAFAYKTNNELKKAHWLFKFIASPTLVKLGVFFTPLALKLKLPIKGIIKKTLYAQFVGGDSIEQTAIVAKELERYNVKIILDYAVEGKEGEENFDLSEHGFIKVIEYSSTQKNIPYIGVKVTGFARFALLEKIQNEMAKHEGNIFEKYEKAMKNLSSEEAKEWSNVLRRIKNICEAGAKHNIGVQIDSEETWIQDPIDVFTMQLMENLNKEKFVVYNTLQMYRTDRMDVLKYFYDYSVEKKFKLGIKLVRGAYMEKERKRAAEMNYADPILPNKPTTDKSFDDATKFCIDHIDSVAVIVASHNEESNMLGVKLLTEKNLPISHPQVHFSQLYGMSDNITFNLAKAGCSVSKYLPFGKIKDVVPYLMRRAQENTSIEGQTSRELNLLDKEIKRRGI